MNRAKIQKSGFERVVRGGGWGWSCGLKKQGMLGSFLFALGVDSVTW